MSVQLYGVQHAPASLPNWHTILDDLGNPSPGGVARALGISKRSVFRYSQTGYAPRVVNMALFWLTRWGRSHVHALATNDAIVACGLVSGLRADIARLEANVRHLSQLSYGASNDPLIGGPHER